MDVGFVMSLKLGLFWSASCFVHPHCVSFDDSLHCIMGARVALIYAYIYKYIYHSSYGLFLLAPTFVILHSSLKERGFWLFVCLGARLGQRQSWRNKACGLILAASVKSGNNHSTFSYNDKEVRKHVDVSVGAENSSFTDCQCFFGGSSWIALNQFFTSQLSLRPPFFLFRRHFFWKNNSQLHIPQYVGFAGVLFKRCVTSGEYQVLPPIFIWLFWINESAVQQASLCLWMCGFDLDRHHEHVSWLANGQRTGNGCMVSKDIKTHRAVATACDILLSWFGYATSKEGWPSRSETWYSMPIRLCQDGSMMLICWPDFL